MRHNWSAAIEQQKALQRKVKNLKGVSEYFTEIPEKGFMRDNISKKLIELKEAKSSTLRRYVKLLGKYYSLCTTPEMRSKINEKLTEVENELSTRPDAIADSSK